MATSISNGFICGLINILITVTKIRKMIIKAIPEFTTCYWWWDWNFVAYVGLKNAGLLSFTVQAEPQNGVVNGSSIVPALGNFDNPAIILAVIGLVLTTILVVTNVRGAILIGIVVTTLVAIPMGW